jgi:hypothetical protein
VINTSTEALLHDAREVLSAAGLRYVTDTEVWISGDEVVLKAAVAPADRPGAAAIPGRVQEALRAGGLALAMATDSATPYNVAPADALSTGHAVRIVRGP